MSTSPARTSVSAPSAGPASSAGKVRRRLDISHEIGIFGKIKSLLPITTFHNIETQASSAQNVLGQLDILTFYMAFECLMF